VIRVASGKPAARSDAITGFDTSDSSGNFLESSGPRGVLFLDRSRLVVAGGDAKGLAFIRLYELSDGKDQQKPLTADQREQNLAPPAAGESEARIFAFHALARTNANDLVPDLLILAAQAKDSAPAVWKVHVRAGTLDELKPFRTTASPANAKTTSAVAVGSHGYILLSQLAAVDGAAQSRLEFLNPVDASPIFELSTKLQEVVALAYSPRSGNLYAADFASRDSQRGGIYRLDDAGEPGKPVVAAVKVADVSRPTAIAFAPDGALYVTALGSSDGQAENSGVLLKLTGEL
jgi:hypothetical protein